MVVKVVAKTAAMAVAERAPAKTERNSSPSSRAATYATSTTTMRMEAMRAMAVATGSTFVKYVSRRVAKRQHPYTSDRGISLRWRRSPIE